MPRRVLFVWAVRHESDLAEFAWLLRLAASRADLVDVRVFCTSPSSDAGALQSRSAAELGVTHGARPQLRAEMDAWARFHAMRVGEDQYHDSSVADFAREVGGDDVEESRQQERGYNVTHHTRGVAVIASGPASLLTEAKRVAVANAWRFKETAFEL